MNLDKIYKVLNRKHEELELSKVEVELTSISDFNKLYAASIDTQKEVTDLTKQIKTKIERAIKGYSKTLLIGETIEAQAKELGVKIPAKVEVDIKESKKELSKLKSIKI